MSIPISRIDFTPRAYCSSRKVGYDSEREVRVFVSRQRDQAGEADWYRCKECSRWHVTTTITGGERKRRATRRATYRRLATA